MDHDAFMRIVVESVVERYLREISEDPKRSIRKLVDMGGQFAKGPFQSYFFDISQTMLENEDSPYYTLIRNAVEGVDHEILKTFGINTGLNGWSRGAARIRKFEAELGCEIPWAIFFHLAPGVGGNQMARCQRLIREGKELGMYVYLFEMREGADLSELIRLFHAEPECAFVLMLPKALVDENSVRLLAECKNLLISVSAQKPGWEKAAAHLRRTHCLWGAHIQYSTHAQAMLITSGAWTEKLLCQGPLFAFCFARPDCSDEDCAAVQEYAHDARVEQKYPVLLIDYYTDHLFIDRIISQRPCYLGITADGRATACDGYRETETELSADNFTLRELLNLRNRN
ncbi:MAG: hypothetical protein LKK00_06540 [Intestinimonas sp.]|nr:hypothetical protein [Intestinimonas sp.]